ncbi:MAG: UDP-N-acetylmuramate dehydrogenase, partial [Acidimicrobiia bacterium]|nr:UDP-N-acetylmuramate dehydrogenase [Acidimicrobiia bacterium]
ADESDASFLHLGAAAAIVTNVEPDHLERYGGSGERLLEAFHRFLEGAGGSRVVCVDDPGAREAAAGIDVVAYGLGPGCRYRAVDVQQTRWGSRFNVVKDDSDLGVMEVALPGLHNVRNALGASAMAFELGADAHGVRQGLARFRGVRRRYDFRGTRAGITFVDDYAHLASEVAATLDTAAEGGWDRVVAVFQPHLYSRTRRDADGLGQALARADLAFVTDVFAAREDPVPGVTGRLVADAVSRAGGDVRYVEHRRDLAARVAPGLRAGDVCVSLGAGDITTLADELAELLETGAASSPLEACAQDLADELSAPPQRDLPLAPMTTYKVGGAAAVYVEPESEEELLIVRGVVQRHDVPVLVMGRGSNMLVSDAGFPGVAMRLGSGFNWIEYDGVSVRAGGATPLPFLARAVARHGLSRLEFGVGIPASVGGAVRMNAGGHGAVMQEVLTRVGVVGLSGVSGGVEERPASDLDMGYRRTNLASDEVVVWAEFALSRGERPEIEAAMAEIVHWRKDNQPAGSSAGSIFKNPEGDSAGRLIDTAGCKGIRVGGAYVSDKHANFVIAEGWARAQDVYAVMRLVRERVREVHGVILEPEVRLVGHFEEQG